MVGREQQTTGLLIARPCGCDVAWLFGSAPMIDEFLDSTVRPDVEVPCVSRRIAANLRWILHRHELGGALSNRQFLVVLHFHIRASVPVNMEREERPIIVVDEGRLNVIFHVGGRAVQLRAKVCYLHRLAVFIFRFIGHLPGLGLPLPGTTEIQFQGRELQVERIADRFNLPIRIKPIGLGKLFDNGWARLCPGSARQQHHQKQATDRHGTAQLCHEGSSSVNDRMWRWMTYKGPWIRKIACGAVAFTLSGPLSIAVRPIVRRHKQNGAASAQPVRRCEFHRPPVQGRSCATACCHSPNQPAVLGAFAGTSRNSRASRIKSFATSMS